MDPRREKTCLRGFANKGADQPAHMRSVVSALLFAYLKVSYLASLRAKFQISNQSL